MYLEESKSIKRIAIRLSSLFGLSTSLERLLISLEAMKNRHLSSFLTIALICAAHVHAQEPLSISEAVMGSFSEFAPENLESLQWIPGTDTYSYVDRSKDIPRVMKGFADERADEEVFDLGELRQHFQGSGFVQPDEIPPFEWLDDDHILFSFKGQFWDYSTKWKAVAKRISCVRTAQGHELSPNKTMAAYVIGRDIYISNAEKDSIRLTNNPAGVSSGQVVSRYEFGIEHGAFWSPTSERLAFYQKDESNVDSYSLMDYAPIPAKNDEIKYPMSGHASEHVLLKVFHLKTGELITLNTGLPLDQYLTGITWDIDGIHLYVTHISRDQDEVKLLKYDSRSGKPVAMILEEEDEEYVEPEQGPYVLSGKAQGLLWFSERDGYNHIYHYDRKGNLKAQLTKGEHVMKKILYVDVEAGVIYVSGTGSPIESVLYSVPLNGGEMKRITQEKGTHKITFSTTGSYFIDELTSLKVPRRIMVKDKEGKIVKTLLEAKDPFIGRSIGTTEVFTIKGEKEMDLFCRMIKPSTFDARKKYPVLIYVYNGPHAQLVKDRWIGGASLWMHHLAEKGYIVFTLDGRGSNYRGLEFEQSVHGRLGELELRDQMLGVEFLKSKAYVDQNRMAVHGWSFGGFMTLNMMLREPDVFKVGVAGGPVTDWRFYEIMYTERYMETPEDNPAGYEETRLPRLADQLKGDLMLIHGSSDDVVVPQHSMVMLNAFINEGKQVDFFMYPGHKHNVRGVDRVHLMTKVINYIDHSLDKASEAAR